MKESVKVEVVLKLLDVGIIYHIYDSNWVSSIQVIPKKSNITVVKNENDELITTSIRIGWRICINYKKLNLVTMKDQFLFPFMDKILKGS